ncbi:hypothetical protein CJ030_MR7G011622 [Morella rubra]|uniref:F-box protein n=1 Tax=Morella rubra TaxID=262757 RepID=A0A6A1V3U0_9ROSI|nr:hypothetical protein CJ030_MR7G011622 [Morella rubra]
MSSRGTQSCHAGDTMTGESLQRYQSVWMAHWTSASCKSPTQACSNSSIPFKSKEEVHGNKKHSVLGGPGIATEIYTEQYTEVTKAKKVNVVNESPTTSSKTLRRERLVCQPFPMFNLSQKKELGLASKSKEAMHHGEVLSSRDDLNSGHTNVRPPGSKSFVPSMSARASPDTDTLECCFRPGGISPHSEQQVISHKDLEMSSLAISTSLQDDFTRSSLKIVPHGFTRGRTSLQSVMTQEEINQSGKSLLRQKEATLLLNDPSTSSNQQAHLVGKQGQTLQNHYGIGFFPSRSSLTEGTQSEKRYGGCYSLRRLPCSVHDVETMRIYATVNSMEGSPRTPSKFSQTTRHLLITRETDVDVCDKHQIVGDSTVYTKFKGNTFGELHSLSPGFHFPLQCGVKLQPLKSSTDSRGKENVTDLNISVGLKNESSAETDTMDMDAFQENHHPGVAPSLPNKHLKEKSSISQAVDASAGEEIGGGSPHSDLFDINQALPDLPLLASPVGCGETSSSRTHSLEVEGLLSQAEPMTSKSSGCPGGLLGPEPSGRWIKRLKLRASGSSYGTKSSKMREASSHEKVNKSFRKFLKGGITSAEPTTGRSDGKDKITVDQNAVLFKKGESFSVDPEKKSQYVTLSNPWIQRWCRNRAASPKKKPAAVVCEPQCSKAKLDEFEKRRFPSIAAMALMVKAICGFQRCEFRKSGSFVVWNTKGVPP